MTDKYDLSVIIPTYNEEENILKIVSKIDEICKTSGINEEILIVDDDSKDNTHSLVNMMKENMTNLNILIRHDNHGLSQSLYDGFYVAQSQYIQVIDADFAHPPEKIPQIFKLLTSGKYDMVIGSRAVDGGKLENWPLYRKILSLGASIFAKMLLPSIKDSGSGFFAINKIVLDNSTFKPRGFRMGFELLGKGNWKSVIEIPITLKYRTEGKSKLKFKIITDYLLQCYDIAVYNLILHKCDNVKRSWNEYLHKSK